MKKVIVLSNMYPTADHPTFGIFVKNQVTQLENEQIDVEVIAIDEPGTGKLLTIKKYLSWLFRAMFALLKNRKNLSLTHAHYAFPTGMLSLIGKKIFRIPYVVTVHGGDLDKMAKKNERIRKMTERILHHAAHVIVVGERLKEEVITDFNVPENRVNVLSMGVDTTVFKPHAREETRAALHINQDQKVYLFVGNMIREKGVLELVQAFGKVKAQEPDSVLYLIGSQRSTAFLGEVTDIIKAQHIEDVHFKKPLNQEELSKWMAASDVFVLPSYHEGFGLVALEAMATGTPVVGTDVGGLSYLLKDEVGILVNPKDVDSLREGLLQASALKNLDQTKMWQIVEEHSTRTVIKQLLAIYEKIGR